MKSVKLIAAAVLLSAGLLVAVVSAGEAVNSESSAGLRTDSIKAQVVVHDVDPDDDLTILGQHSKTPGKR